MKKFSFLPAIAGLMLLVAACGESSFDRDVRMDGEVPCADCAGLPDADGDGYPDAVDCHDGNRAINPGAIEVCGNGVDDNCNGPADEGCNPSPNDRDGDGHADIADCDDNDPNVWSNCAPSDRDGDGHADGADCAPDDPTRWTDCDGPAACPNGLIDNDRDGYCADAPDALDCDDADARRYPGNAEVCDNVDNDCDGDVDEGCVQRVDNDRDGYFADGGDCDDANAAVNPSAIELCDGINNDCDGQLDENCAVGLTTAVVRVPSRGFRNLCIDVEPLRDHRDATFTVSAATWEDVLCVSGIEGDTAVFDLTVPVGLEALRFDVDYPDGHNSAEGFGNLAHLFTTPMSVVYEGHTYTDADGAITPFSDAFPQNGHTAYGSTPYANFSPEPAPTGREAIYNNQQ